VRLLEESPVHLPLPLFTALWVYPLLALWLEAYSLVLTALEWLVQAQFLLVYKAPQ